MIGAVIGYRRADGTPRIRREEQVVWQGGWAAIGLFDARPDDPHFRCSGIPGEHLVVFPCTSVRIEREGEDAFVADRNLVTFYEPDQAYTRSPVSPRGDRGHWFAIAPAVLEELLHGAGCRPRGRRLLPFGAAAGDLESYRRQSLLVRRLTAGDAVTDLELEEEVLALAHRVLGGARRQAAGRREPTAGRVSLARRARWLLAERWMEPQPLAEIAAALGCSPFHLCRVFRAVTGTSLHAHREQLRLRRALLEIPRRRGDLAALALELGYSSHSHFTAAFRRAVGVPPSRWREGLA
jgi:AraC-like DNA-binding protein